MMQLQIPPNVSLYYQFIISITQIDLLPTDFINEAIFKFQFEETQSSTNQKILFMDIF